MYLFRFEFMNHFIRMSLYEFSRIEAIHFHVIQNHKQNKDFSFKMWIAIYSSHNSCMSRAHECGKFLFNDERHLFKFPGSGGLSLIDEWTIKSFAMDALVHFPTNLLSTAVFSERELPLLLLYHSESSSGFEYSVYVELPNRNNVTETLWRRHRRYPFHQSFVIISAFKCLFSLVSLEKSYWKLAVNTWHAICSCETKYIFELFVEYYWLNRD